MWQVYGEFGLIFVNGPEAVAQRVAGRGGQGLFRIVDGLRRAKAVEMLGGHSISAEVHIGGRVVQRLELSLDLLRAPRAVIDASTPSAALRFSNILEATRAGATLPPIIVTPGATGLRLLDVTLKWSL